MRYKAREVSRITGIPVDTLRYYEKIGVITPKVDETNNYRYYDAWDINFLFEYLNYRKMEYSSKECIHYIHNASLQEQIDMAIKQRDFFQEKCDHYRMLTERNDLHLKSIENISGNLNKIQFENTPNFKYIVYRKNYDFFNSKMISKDLSPWIELVGLTENLVVIPKETIEQKKENDYFWGLMLREDWFHNLHMENNSNVKTIECATCIKTLVEANEAGTFHYHLLDHAMEYIENHNFKLLADPFGILLTRSHDEDRIHRYIEFYLPVA